MNPYERKQEARRQRYLDRAERLDKEAADKHAQAREMASHIPFGQPILVGHHSEKRDRNYRGKINRTFEKAFEAHDTAKHYQGKASSVGKAGISSDDPDAVVKLRAKIEGAEASQATMKAVNAAWRKAKRPAADDADGWQKIAAAIGDALTADEVNNVRLNMARDPLNRSPFPDYALSNNSANIGRMKRRLTDLETRSDAETTEREVNGVRVVENVELNRIQLHFDGKPPADVRALLKSSGFRWSRNEMAWQRHLNNAGRYATERVLAAI